MGNISLPLRSYSLSVLPNNNADIFAASQLTLNCKFSPLIVSSFVMISFYMLSTRFLLKWKELSDARPFSIIVLKYSFVVHLL